MSDSQKPASVTRRRFLLALGGTGATAAIGGWLYSLGRDKQVQSTPPGLSMIRRTGQALGTGVSIAALHEDPDTADRAIAAAFAELSLIESVMSLYRPDSQLCRLNREGELPQPHADLVQVLREAQSLAADSDGAFDVTVQPLWELYANAAQQNRVPEDDEVASARRLVDWRQMEVADNLVRLKNRGSAVTLNGIAQGFAIDRVRAALTAGGVQHALIDTGEIGAMGCRRDGCPWTVGVQHPRHKNTLLCRVPLDGRCLATSGDYETTFTADYEQHHIFDPHTGRSPKELASVTVMARTGLEADALSTAVFVAGPERGKRLLATHGGADGFFVLKSGATWMTAGFPAKVQEQFAGAPAEGRTERA